MFYKCSHLKLSTDVCSCEVSSVQKQMISHRYAVNIPNPSSVVKAPLILVVFLFKIKTHKYTDIQKERKKERQARLLIYISVSIH